MERVYKDCQSCGMPLKKSPNGGGTRADGTISKMYCIHCFQNGEFTNPACTVSEMQNLVKNKMKKMGFPGFLAGFFSRNIPKLLRWSNQA